MKDDRDLDEQDADLEDEDFDDEEADEDEELSEHDEMLLLRELMREMAQKLRPDLVAPPSTAPVAAPGRNDPCPCGSGKKYKRCHGQEG